MVHSDAVAEARRALGRRLAAYRRAAGHTQEAFAPIVRYARSTVANVETGRQNVPRDFWVRSDHFLGCQGALLRQYDGLISLLRQQRLDDASTSPAGGGTSIELALDRPTNRRHVLDLAVGTVTAATLSPQVAKGLGRLAAALTAFTHEPPMRDGTSLGLLTAAVTRSRRSYQACRYAELLDGLPTLLSAVRYAGQQFTADRAAETIQMLSAETYQTSASVLLKFGDPGLALLAADRSLDQARRSGDPIAIASSARVLSHALMAGGHPQRAAEFACSTSDDLRRAGFRSSPESQAVYGALLLRAAIATSRYEDRTRTQQLIEEASDTALQLGGDGNLGWTAFGPTNVLVHRVSTSLTLGDAGRAIDYARQVRAAQLPVAERRAALFIDVARAYAQWGKYDEAYRALRSAEETAPEEVRIRQPVRELIGDLATRTPTSLRRQLQELAQRVGVVA